jgi:hypothetical protein
LASLKFYYTNPTSLNNKWVEVDELMNRFDLDILCFAETWFDETTAPHHNNYDLYRADRVGKDGGGVAIYAHTRTKSRPVSYQHLANTSIEQIWCAVGEQGRSILVGCMYRPKSVFDRLEDEKKMDDLIAALKMARQLVRSGEFVGLVLVGDLNLPNLNWSDSHVASHGGRSGHLDTLADMFTVALDDLFLNQIVDKPTFQTDNGALTNTLDLLITDIQESIDSLIFSKPLGGLRKAHLGLSWNVHLVLNRPSFISPPKRLAYAKGDYTGMNAELASIDWTLVFTSDDVEECYAKFLSKYTELCDKFIPIRSPNKRTMKAIWMTKTLRKSINKAHELWYRNDACKWRDTALKSEYESLEKSNKKWCAKAVHEFEVGLADRSKSDPKLVYNYVKSKQRAKGSIRSLRDPNGEVKSAPADIVNILRSQFDSVFNIDSSEFDEPLDKLTVVECNELNVFPLISPDEVMQKLKALKVGKSTGWDGVHPHVLKHCAEGFASPVATLFKLSITTAAVPKAWRRANVTPIFKKGSKLEPGNYRPVSLTSILCKELEKLIKTAIVEHLNLNKLVSPAQHGFVKRKGCVTNLLEEFDIITLALARGVGILVILLDFAKAFDKVSHKKLRIKLESVGIVGNLLEWIMSFLHGREQRVVLGEACSDWSEVTSGVPQGSVLGPILFIIFINDMPANLRSKILLYADDSKIISEIKCRADFDRTQLELDQICEWSNEWLMELNLDKCKVMKFGCATYDIPLTMTDKHGRRHTLDITYQEKDLGVTVTADLKPTAHCSAAAATGNRVLGLLRRTFITRDCGVWKKLYLSLVRPHLEYASTVWSPAKVGDILKIERVQRRATKSIKSFHKLGYTDRLKRLDLTTLEVRRQRGDLIQVYKMLNGLEDVQLSKPIQIIPTSLYTRGHSRRLALETFPSANVNNFASGVSRRSEFLLNRVRALWNQLPAETITAPNLNSFKARLDKYIASNQVGALSNVVLQHPSCS